MKEQFLNLSGLTELISYIKLCIAQNKVIIPRASFSLFPKTGDENNIYIDTSNNSIYRWSDADKTFILLAKPPRSISISEGKNNGQITLKVDGIESNASVHGLKSAAFSEANSFATAVQGAKADSAVQSITIASGTNNGTVKMTVNGVTTDNIKVAGLGSAAFYDSGTFALASHSHTKTEVGLGNVDNTADKDKSVKYADTSGAVAWDNITGKPSSFPPQDHNHNSLYYQKSEVDSKLSGKSDTGHTHVQFIQETKFSNGTYSDPLKDTSVAIKASGGIAADLIYEGGSTLANKYQAKGNYAAASHKQAYTSGECTVYTTDDNTMGVTPAAVKKAFGLFGPKAHTHKKADITDFPTSLPASDVYAWAKASSKPTYTWSEITNKPSSFTPSSHTHTKSQITDFPTSMPASDVYDWAKAKTKPTYTKSEVGLGNVDNTADANKSVKYATSAGSATNMSGTAAFTTTEAYRHVWFSDSATETARCYNDALKYDPKSNKMTVNITGNATTASSVAWGNVSGKPSTYAPSSHTHAIANVTNLQSELDTRALSKVLATNADLNSCTTPGIYSVGGGNTITNKPSGVNAFGLIVTHNATGTYYTQILYVTDSAVPYRRCCNNGTWGAWSRDVLVNTWRGIQNNLTSDSTTDSLSAAQGKTLKALVDGKAAASHTHSQYYDSSVSRDANTVLAAPNGSAGSATFRKLVAADIPSLTKSKISDFPTTLKNPTSLIVKLNGGTTESTNMFTYDGSSGKTINITPGSIGAATSGHTHNYAGSSSAGGSANSAVKLATARSFSITGGAVASAVSFNGTANVALSVTSLNTDYLVNGSNTLVLSCGGAA